MYTCGVYACVYLHIIMCGAYSYVLYMHMYVKCAYVCDVCLCMWSMSYQCVKYASCVKHALCTYVGYTLSMCEVCFVYTRSNLSL